MSIVVILILLLSAWILYYIGRELVWFAKEKLAAPAPRKRCPESSSDEESDSSDEDNDRY